MSTQTQANIDCLLRKIARDVRDAREINRRGGDLRAELRHIASLLSSVELEVVEVVR